MADFKSYVEQLGDLPLGMLCEEAANLEEKRDRILTGIKRQFVLRKDFLNMDNDYVKLCDDIVEFIEGTTSFLGESGESEIFKHKIAMKKSMFGMATKIDEELEERVLYENHKRIEPTYPTLQKYIDQMNFILLLLDTVVRDSLMYKKSLIKHEFETAYFRKSGLEVGPEFLKPKEKEDELV